MKRTLALSTALLLGLTANLPAQSCLGTTAGPGQMSAGALWTRSSSVNGYGLAVNANFGGPLGAAFDYSYSGASAEFRNRDVHSAEGLVAYEVGSGALSVCPAVGFGYLDGKGSVVTSDPGTGEPMNLHPSWRELTVPLQLHAGLRVAGPGALTLTPTVSGGGLWRHFEGRGGAVIPVEDETRSSASQLAWVASVGLTAGWERFWVSATYSDDTLPLTRTELRMAAGWVVPWDFLIP
jgi:hypothetical protein